MMVAARYDRGNYNCGNYETADLKILVVVQNRDVERQVVLDSLPAFIGQSAAAEVCIGDRWVQPFHRILEMGGSRLVLADLGSTSGTYVNGRRVQKIDLQPGDRIRVGNTNLVVQYGRQAGVQPTLGRVNRITRWLRLRVN